MPAWIICISHLPRFETAADENRRPISFSRYNTLPLCTYAPSPPFKSSPPRLPRFSRVHDILKASQRVASPRASNREILNSTTSTFFITRHICISARASRVFVKRNFTIYQCVDALLRYVTLIRHDHRRVEFSRS